MKASYIAMCAVLLLVLAVEVQVSMAVTCNPTELAPCASAIAANSKPTAMCCTKITQQKPCLCKYIKDPNLKGYVSTPNAKKVASTCGVPFPKC